MKNCDRGLENAARGRRPRAAFSSPSHSFSLYGPTLSLQITYLFISCYKLAYKWVYATLSLNWPCLRAVHEPSEKLNLTSERASNLKKHVLKNRFISNYFKLNFRKLKVALNPMYRIFSNFAKSCISFCLSKFYNKKKFHRAVFEI